MVVLPGISFADQTCRYKLSKSSQLTYSSSLLDGGLHHIASCDSLLTQLSCYSTTVLLRILV